MNGRYDLLVKLGLKEKNKKSETVNFYSLLAYKWITIIWVNSIVTIISYLGKLLTKATAKSRSDYLLVDTVEKVKTAVNELLVSEYISVDIEGVNLCRTGRISIIQVANQSKFVYLFDITKLLNEAFDYGLKEVLESSLITKVFYDVRADCDALYHQYKILPINVLDCQIAFMRAPERRFSRYNLGFKRALQCTDVITNQQEKEMTKIKEEGRRLFAPEFGGSYAVFDERPIPSVLLDYLITDTVVLLDLLQEQLQLSGLTEYKLNKISEKRMKRAVYGDKPATGRQMARRDI